MSGEAHTTEEGTTMEVDVAASEHPQPPFSCKVRYLKGVVCVKVTLTRIPEHCINFDPTATHFYLDTFKYSKRFMLRFQYPGGIKVKASKNFEANLEYGILTAELPVVDWGTLNSTRQEALTFAKEKHERLVAKKKAKQPVISKTSEKKKRKRAEREAAKAAKKAGKNGEVPAQNGDVSGLGDDASPSEDPTDAAETDGPTVNTGKKPRPKPSKKAQAPYDDGTGLISAWDLPMTFEDMLADSGATENDEPAKKASKKQKTKSPEVAAVEPGTKASSKNTGANKVTKQPAENAGSSKAKKQKQKQTADGTLTSPVASSTVSAPSQTKLRRRSNAAAMFDDDRLDDDTVEFFPASLKAEHKQKSNKTDPTSKGKKRKSTEPQASTGKIPKAEGNEQAQEASSPQPSSQAPPPAQSKKQKKQKKKQTETQKQQTPSVDQGEQITQSGPIGKKQKKFAEKSEMLLSIAQQASERQENTAQGKLQAEKSKQDFFEKKTNESAQKKLAKTQRKEQSRVDFQKGLAKAKAQHQVKQQNKKQKSKKK